jgi:hypothetical protein
VGCNSIFECPNCLIEIYGQLIAVYGEGVMNESDVRKCCQLYNKGRTNGHDKEQFRHPVLINEDLKNRSDQQIRTNKCFALGEIHEKFPEISRLLIY